MTQPRGFNSSRHPPQRRALKGRKKTTLNGARFALKTKTMFVR
jgi:hypothetical protein